MGSIRMDEWDGQPVYLVRYRASIDIAINLQDEDWMELAVKFTPNAKAEVLSETLPSSWGEDSPGDFQARLAVTAANTLALQATAFEWDAASEKCSHQFSIDPEAVEIVRHACAVHVRLRQELFAMLHRRRVPALEPKRAWYRRWF